MKVTRVDRAVWWCGERVVNIVVMSRYVRVLVCRDDLARRASLFFRRGSIKLIQPACSASNSDRERERGRTIKSERRVYENINDVIHIKERYERKRRGKGINE